MRTKTYYFVEDDDYGQHGTDIIEVKLTSKEYRKVKETRVLEEIGRGFITDDYVSALYYTQD